MIVLDCIEDGCTFQTQEVEQEVALQLLTLHVNTQYTAAGAAVGGRQQAAQGECALQGQARRNTGWCSAVI